VYYNQHVARGGYPVQMYAPARGLPLGTSSAYDTNYITTDMCRSETAFCDLVKGLRIALCRLKPVNIHTSTRVRRNRDA